jgi:catechol 1,2-dioxygenase
MYTRRLLILTAAIALVLYSVPSFADDTTKICPRTEDDVEGPFYVPETPFRTDIASEDEPGERIVIKGRVLQTDCATPVKDALIEVWQTDAQGNYHYQDEGYRLRGQMKADEKGNYSFSTIKPGRYRIMRGFRPAHIHIKVSYPGFETLTTQLYFEGDPYLWPNDACGPGCRSKDPERIVALNPEGEGKVLEGSLNMFMKPVAPEQ